MRGPDEAAEETDPIGGWVPEPPLQPAVQLLPFEKMPWEAFEVLITRMVGELPDVTTVSQYGTPGQSQDGIDLYAHRRNGTVTALQCKRHKALTPGVLRSAVEAFVAGKWATESALFVVCTSDSEVPTQIVDATEELRGRLRALDPPVAFEVWGAHTLSRILKNYPVLVQDVFGDVWAARFAPQFAQAQQESTMASLAREVRSLKDPPLFISAGGTSGAFQDTLERFEQQRPGRLRQFAEQLGSKFDPERIRAFVVAPPPWMDDADFIDWQFIGRAAEARHLWAEASVAFERAALVADSDYDRAGALTSAGACAGVAEDRPRRKMLFEGAAEAFPAHPRLLVITMDPETPPARQVALLNEVTPKSRGDAVLVESQLAIAHMLQGDLKSAAEHIEKVRERESSPLMRRTLAFSLAVQRGRIDLTNGDALDGGALRDATEEGRALRQELLEQRRYSEAAQMLMLTADAYGLLWQRDTAARVLRTATPEELASDDGVVVLGASAMRMLLFDVALELLQDADLENDDIALIRAVSMLDAAGGRYREEALDELDRLVTSDGFVAVQASFHRLEATFNDDVPWNDVAEERLLAGGYDRHVVQLKAFRASDKGRQLDAAREVLGEYRDEPWALALLFRLSVFQDNHTVIARAARDALAAGPTQQVRADAGQALARCGFLDEAFTVLMQVARDQNAPTSTRCDAYEALVTIAGRGRGDWKQAGRLFDAWVGLRPLDPRSNAWAPMVHARRGRTGQ